MGFLKDLIVREVVFAVAKKVVESWPSERKPEREPTAAELEAYRRHDEDCREIERRRELKKKAEDKFATDPTYPLKLFSFLFMMFIGFGLAGFSGVIGFLVLTVAVTVIAQVLSNG
jgi:hypothetical protein